MHRSKWAMGLAGRAAVVASAAVLTTAGMYAQSVTQGAITGTVQDVTGAVVPNATVVIVNTGTNATVKLTADGKGFFLAPLLQPGTYKVTINAGGFGQYVADRVTVQVSQTTTLEPRLTTGQAETTVTVTDTTPAINTESPDFSDVLDNRAIVDLPENNRRWSSLALLTPGVVSDSNGFGLVSIRGISPILNNVEIDGADDNQAYFSEERGRTREAYSTSEDAVREFQVNTGVYSAEFGRAAGGVINSVTKSGSNQLHGEAYFYDRQSSWGAYNPLATISALNSAGTLVTTPYKPKDLRKIWGFAAGGALIKDKLFWYYTYDQHHRLFPAVAQPSNQTTFYRLPDATLPSGATCNPATGYLTGSTTTNSNYTLDSQVCTLAAREKTTYAAAVSNYTTDLANLSGDLGITPRFGDQEINTPKLDFQITPKQRLSLLYHRLRWDSPGGVQTAATVNYGRDTQGNDFVKLDYGLGKLESQITNSISNEIGYQYGRELDYETQQPLTPYTLNNLTNSLTGPTNTPEVTFSSSVGAFSLGSPYYSYRLAYPDERKWQVFDTVYYVRGGHSFKFGTDILHNYDLINNTYESNGVFNYSTLGNYFADVDGHAGRAAINTCNSGASSAGTSTTNATGTLPCYTSYTQGYGNPLFDISTLDYGFFAQDNWKVNPRLTLELGVRYDYEQLPNPSATLTQATGTFTPYTGLTNRPSDKNNIGPRAGFAYDVFGGGNTVLRGGFGLYYGRMTNGTILNAYLNTGSPLGQYTTTYRTTTAGHPTFPSLTATGTGAAPAQPTSQYFSSNFQNPQVMEYDLLLQQNVGRGTVANISYLASQGRELPNFLNVNLDPTTVQNATITFTGGGPIPNGTQVVVPTYTKYGNKALFGPNAANFQAITEIVSNVNSSYNAFVAEIKNNSIAGVEFDASYTWSHALDYAQNASTSASTNSFYDPYGNFRANYGNSSYNVPNRIAGYALWRIPTKVQNPYLKYATNNWSINDDFQLQNGLPYSLGLSGYNSNNAVQTLLNGAGGQSFVPTSVLNLPGLGRNTYQQRRAIVDDIRLIKGIPFTGRYNLELRGDFFNIANHENVSSVNTTGYTFSDTGALTSNAAFGTTTFGVPTAINASGFLYTPREIQLSARFAF
ncbi:MAG TPA: carboxypeptidase regulatory-like domain-containing protein [Acidobacteriaceae bacterium]|nr:carboxypeptidase regulatory-like domain-containing protein [Acidobacteriaceae bacterium]